VAVDISNVPKRQNLLKLERSVQLSNHSPLFLPCQMPLQTKMCPRSAQPHKCHAQIRTGQKPQDITCFATPVIIIQSHIHGFPELRNMKKWSAHYKTRSSLSKIPDFDMLVVGASKFSLRRWSKAYKRGATVFTCTNSMYAATADSDVAERMKLPDREVVAWRKERS